MCPACGEDYQPGMPLPGVLEALFDYAEISRRWQELPAVELFCPLEERYFPEIPVGNTPFYQSFRLGKVLGLSNVWLKNDSLNPSGSLKDRASLLLAAESTRLGETKVVTASTGNAASALAAVCAAAGLQAVIFAPGSAPPAKLAQIKVHGAELILVDGTYDDAFAQSLAYTQKNGGLNRNTAYHPFTIEGKKTAGLEIFLQNGQKVPDWLVVPVGDGVILAGIHKAFIDLQRAGIISRLPRLLAVQADSSDAITSYWETGKYADARKPYTIADSISVRTPSNAHWAVRALHETKGHAVRVTDKEILAAQKELACLTGVFAEPAAAAALAGLQKAVGEKINAEREQVVLLITGHGLKDITAVAQHC